MMRVALLLALLIPSTSLASTKVLLLEDVGSEKAHFSWNKASGGQVAFSATVDRPICLDEDCFDYHSTGALKGFKREARDVYYVGDGSRAPILCGQTHGLFTRPRFNSACRIGVEPELVCEAWYAGTDCIRAVTKYRVYLTIDE
jgi:hypothetical protein